MITRSRERVARVMAHLDADRVPFDRVGLPERAGAWAEEIGLAPDEGAYPPPERIKRMFGDRLTLWGCTATQSTYAAGTATQVEAELRRLVHAVARGGGLVVQFYNVLLTPRVEENLKHFMSLFPRLGGR